MPKHRLQIILDDEQLAILTRVAEREQRTVAEVAADLVADHLPRKPQSREEALQRLAEINEHRQALQRQIGTIDYVFDTRPGE